MRVLRLPAEQVRARAGVHQDGPAEALDPLGLGGHEGQAGHELGAASTARSGTGTLYQPSASARSAIVSVPGAGQVVDARLAAAEDRRPHSALATSSWWTSWKGTPGSGITGLSAGMNSSARSTGEASARELDVGDALEQRQRVGPGHDARAKHVGVGRRPSSSSHSRLQFGLLGRVVVAVGAARRRVLGQQLRVVSVEAVGGHRRGVDQARHARIDGGAERRCEIPRG